VNAEFFALAFTAALNPKLLAVDLLLIENRRPRAMFLAVLFGGLTVGITIGLLDVFTIKADAINSQRTASAGLDLALGLLLLAVGALVATGRLHGRRKAAVPAGDGQPAQAGAGQPAQAGDGQPGTKEETDGWARRVLGEPRLGLAVLIGAVIGLPGAAYLTALHNLVAGKYSTATQVTAVIVFVLIEFLLIIIPFGFLVLRPEGTRAALRNAQEWLRGHTHQLIAYTCLVLGAYLTVSAVIRLA
jgi:Sap, sulfolipid-1-addressing protein